MSSLIPSLQSPITNPSLCNKTEKIKNSMRMLGEREGNKRYVDLEGRNKGSSFKNYMTVYVKYSLPFPPEK